MGSKDKKKKKKKGADGDADIPAWMKKVAGAEPSRRGVYWKDGSYPLARIRTVSERHGEKGHSVIVESVVLEAAEGAANTVGQTVSTVYKMEKPSNRSNLKRTVAAAFGADLDDEDVDWVDLTREFMSGVSALGRLVSVEARETMLEADPKRGLKERPFTYVDFHAVDEQYQKRADEIEDAALGG